MSANSPFLVQGRASAAPNFHFCGPEYGQGLSLFDCVLAAEQLPIGGNLETWDLHDSSLRYHLPMRLTYG